VGVYGVGKKSSSPMVNVPFFKGTGLQVSSTRVASSQVASSFGFPIVAESPSN